MRPAPVNDGLSPGAPVDRAQQRLPAELQRRDPERGAPHSLRVHRPSARSREQPQLLGRRPPHGVRVETGEGAHLGRGGLGGGGAASRRRGVVRKRVVLGPDRSLRVVDEEQISPDEPPDALAEAALPCGHLAHAHGGHDARGLHLGSVEREGHPLGGVPPPGVVLEKSKPVAVE